MRVFSIYRKHDLPPESCKLLNELILEHLNPQSSESNDGASKSSSDTTNNVSPEVEKNLSTDKQEIEQSCAEKEQTPPYPSSFKEVMKCIETGVDIPGIEKITVEPTNEEITKCDASVPKKPWER